MIVVKLKLDNGKNMVRLNGARLVGDQTKPCLVLLHSSMSSSVQWRSYLSRLEEQYYILNIDLLGYGTAIGSVTDNYTLTTEVARITAMLKQLNITEISLLGHSFGGAVALKLLHQSVNNNSINVKTAILFEPVSFHLVRTMPEVLAPISDLLSYLDDCSDDKVARAFIEFWNGKGSFDAFPKAVQQQFVKEAPKVMADFSALMGDEVCLSDLTSIETPVLLMQGQHSPDITRRLVHLIASNVINSDIRDVAGGHMAPITHAKNVLGQIEAWLMA